MLQTKILISLIDPQESYQCESLFITITKMERDPCEISSLPKENTEFSLTHFSSGSSEGRQRPSNKVQENDNRRSPPSSRRPSLQEKWNFNMNCNYDEQREFLHPLGVERKRWRERVVRKVGCVLTIIILVL
ncbi:hypothetical protein AVEN_53397-1 [Araneus ventricosus]|uniref:Uncharacterized protein n=1 Tax=Araneus ventricosus TaxID=182803 RepID=A0A4Y2ABL1_ARAVE|nr:hypothetical protein AVEN_53397-1 [Araneus ventricosus]